MAALDAIAQRVGGVEEEEEAPEERPQRLEEVGDPHRLEEGDPEGLDSRAEAAEAGREAAAEGDAQTPQPPPASTSSDPEAAADDPAAAEASFSDPEAAAEGAAQASKRSLSKQPSRILAGSLRFSSSGEFDEAGEEDGGVWSIDHSVYAKRRVNAEGRQYLDTREVFDRRLDVDWEHAVAKRRFRDVIARSDDDGSEGLTEELHECKEVRRVVRVGLRPGFQCLGEGGASPSTFLKITVGGFALAALG